MRESNSYVVFFTLLRAGLWEKEVGLASFGEIGFDAVLQIAEEQSVVGLVTVGLEHVKNVKVPQEVLLEFIGQTLKLEQQNKAMNGFIAKLIERMRVAGIYTLLVKGQGIAQCYEKPLWRTTGDVDLFLSEDNYEKARRFLTPMASEVDTENKYEKHLAMTIDSWVVELHGNLRCGLSSRIDRVLDDIKRNTFGDGNVRSWINGRTPVFLPIAENDALYVLTHILSHFYKGGIGLRQICDWCRLLWTYRAKIDLKRLEVRIRQAGLMSEWKSFGAFAVNYLGMPSEAMPFYSADKKWKRKADKICAFVLEVGNFGHNRDMSYYSNYPFIIRKAISFSKRCGDLIRHAQIFPLDSFRFLPFMIINGMREALRGK